MWYICAGSLVLVCAEFHRVGIITQKCRYCWHLCGVSYALTHSLDRLTGDGSLCPPDVAITSHVPSSICSEADIDLEIYVGPTADAAWDISQHAQHELGPLVIATSGGHNDPSLVRLKYITPIYKIIKYISLRPPDITMSSESVRECILVFCSYC